MYCIVLYNIELNYVILCMWYTYIYIDIQIRIYVYIYIYICSMHVYGQIATPRTNRNATSCKDCGKSRWTDQS